MDEESELAGLQRRAYGPAPDLDPAERARLADLQERARLHRAERWGAGAATADTAGADARAFGAHPPSVVPAGDAVPVPMPESGGAARGRPRDPSVVRPDPAPAGEAPAARAAAADDAPAPRRRWLRPLLLLATGAAVGAIVTGAVLVSGDSADAELGIVDGASWSGLSAFGLEPRRHEDYRGVRVESTRNDELNCLAVSYDVAGPDGEMAGIGSMGGTDCAPAGTVATVSIWIGQMPLDPGWGGAVADDIEAGTFLRLELHGDVVRVWRHGPVRALDATADD